MERVFIQAEALQQRLAEGLPTVIFDCRVRLNEPAAGRALWQQGAIGGAHYADLEQDLSTPRADHQGGRHPLPDRQAFADWLGQCGVSEQHTVVVYDDQGGAFAARLWWMLRWVGHEAVLILDGGLPAWLAAGFELTPGQAATPASESLALKPALVDTVSLVELTQADRGGFQLLDARAHRRFTGEQEPFSAVAGHIPGAWSLPFELSLQANGRLKPADELRARFAPLADIKALACSCGSGVTACHNIAVMTALGLPAPRLYVGSWSEWSAQENPHVARGAAPSQPAELA